MTVTITSFRVDSKGDDVPYLIVNSTFKIARDDTFLFDQALADSSEYRKVLAIDDPKRYEEFLFENWDLSKRYDGYSHSWIHNERPWIYLPKFDTFWFREWLADCSVTRAIINDLQFYSENGKLPDIYRSVEGGIILNHFRTLDTYWD